MNVALFGATGAVGQEVLRTLLGFTEIEKISTFGRREVSEIQDSRVRQHIVDIFKPQTYLQNIEGHGIAICTLGVGEPSKMSKEQFIKIDKVAVLDFAEKCKEQGIQHFELLASVGSNAT